MKRIVIGICILALLPCLCWAEELTGRDIALKMDAVDTSEDSKRTAIMVIKRKGQKLMKKMEWMSPSPSESAYGWTVTWARE